MRRLAEQSGQTAAEYLGILLVVSTVIAAIIGSGVDQRLSDVIGQKVCEITGGTCLAPSAASRPDNETDTDLDGVPDVTERRLGTDPRSADSDHDGLTDATETNPLIRAAVPGLDPTKVDGDGDGTPDGVELAGRGINAVQGAGRVYAGLQAAAAAAAAKNDKGGPSLPGFVKDAAGFTADQAKAGFNGVVKPTAKFAYGQAKQAPAALSGLICGENPPANPALPGVAGSCSSLADRYRGSPAFKNAAGLSPATSAQKALDAFARGQYGRGALHTADFLANFAGAGLGSVGKTAIRRLAGKAPEALVKATTRLSGAARKALPDAALVLPELRHGPQAVREAYRDLRVFRTDLLSHGDRRVIVIGETQPRVSDYAKRKGYSEYSPPHIRHPDGELETLLRLERNQRFIRGAIRRGVRIVDLGTDPGRPTRSAFYILEDRELSAASYTRDKVPPR